MSSPPPVSLDPLVAPDRPRPVRPGEELPLEPLAAWLRDHLEACESEEAAASGAAASGAAAEAPEGSPSLSVEQFPGGHSNLTYLLRFDGRELVLRRPPLGASVKTAHDMGREYRVLSRLHRRYPKAPRALAACEDPAVIGAPFFLMERVHGVILRRLPAGAAPAPERLRASSEAAVDALAELHAVDPAAAGLADLLTLFEEPSYVSLPRLVSQNANFDFIFIDGWHSFDYTFVDYFYSDLLLRDGGILVFDDWEMPQVHHVCWFLETHKAYERITEFSRWHPLNPLLRLKSIFTRTGRTPTWGSICAYRKIQSTTIPWNFFESEFYPYFRLYRAWLKIRGLKVKRAW